MKIKIEVEIPKGNFCSGCKFIKWHTYADFGDCLLFGANINANYDQKCQKCLELSDIKGAENIFMEGMSKQTGEPN